MLRSPSDDDGPDTRLAHQVSTRILEEPRLLGSSITVQVQNRVVDLAGTVGSLYARITAADLARSTPGVADVCNRLRLTRAADVSAAPEPFDEIVARWADEPADRGGPVAASPGSTFRFGAAATAGVAMLLWLVVVPEFGAAGLLVVLPFLGAAVTLARLARKADAAG
ncbi:BON domain-containing protein [Actinoplanes sp. DH11]|uniref:BON domain-containing protein n=1 Tax=Actinoplanes sp. DH11 TaxID=2857011 RepID=UPI001E5DFEF9|nr:BON domain-containing protein [Actinoplanes sp. DH11]